MLAGNNAYKFPELQTEVGGTLTCQRIFTDLTTGIPSSYPSYPQGVTPILSFRADPVQMASGSLDSALEAFADLVPADSHLIYYHEAETLDKGITAPNLQAAQARFLAVTKSVSNSFKLWQVFSCYSAKTGRITEWTCPGFDGYGFDCYPYTLNESPDDVLGLAIAQCKESGYDIPAIGVMECGSTRVADRAMFLSATYELAIGYGAEMFCSFGVPGDTEFVESDPASVSTMRIIALEAPGVL
jgi:hypothetical protein